MKIKEVKTKISKSQLNELQLSSLLGDYGAAQMKQAFGAGGGRTKQDIMTQNIFIKNFVSNALTSLKSAIQSGVVDPKKKIIPKAQAGDFEKRVQPKTATAADIGDFDLKDKLAKEKQAQAQAAKDAEVAKVATNRINRAAASPTSPQASAAVDARLQRATQAQQAQTTPASTVDDRLEKAAAQRTQTTQPNVPVSKSKVRKSELFNPLKSVPDKTTESTYDRLNKVFERILNETVAAPDENTSDIGIEQYLKDVWFPNYMKGVDTTANTQKIDQIVKQVADTYPKDGGRAALTQLANLSFAISPKKTKPQPKQDAQPAKAADQDVAAAAQEVQPVVSIGKDKYTKGKRGWMNDKKQLVSAAMAQTLDQLSQVQSSNDEKVEPERQQQLPFSGSTTDGNVTTLKRTGTNESKKRKKNESNRINKITKR